MPGAIWYPPPEPVQPGPHVPIPAQGQQPPRYSILPMMACVLACTPTGFEYQPQRKVPTVPIPAQGQQPPPYSHVNADTIRRAWEPPDPQPVQLLKSAIPSLTRVDNPPLYMGLLEDMFICVQSWTPPDPMPTQRVRYVPIPAQGDQPPKYTGILADEMVAILAWTPPDPMPYQRGPFAPIPPPIINVPTPVSTVYLNLIVQLWTPPDPQPQRKLPTVPIPAQGDQPPRFRLPTPDTQWYDVPALPTMPEQTAAVVPTVVALVPFKRQPESILSAWQPEPGPVQRIKTVPIPRQGDRPPAQRSPVDMAMPSWLIDFQPWQPRKLNVTESGITPPALFPQNHPGIGRPPAI